MSDERFDLVFDGRLATGFSQAQVRQNMAELFSLGDTQLEALFSGRVVVLKRGLDKGLAIRFRNRLAQVGALGLIRPAATEAAEQPAPAAPVVAPKPVPKPAAVRPAAAQPAPKPAPSPKQPTAAVVPEARATAAARAAPAAPAVQAKAPAPAQAPSGGDAITCPRCGHEQSRSNSCGSCRMDLRLHLQRLEKRARLVAARRG